MKQQKFKAKGLRRTKDFCFWWKSFQGPAEPKIVFLNETFAKTTKLIFYGLYSQNQLCLYVEMLEEVSQ